MPFWAANFLERMLVVLIPLATVAVPLVRGIPAFMKWRVQRMLTYWYRRLNRLERGIEAGTSSTDAQSRELAAINDAVSALKLPRAYSEPYFTLRGHIDMVRYRIAGRAAPG